MCRDFKNRAGACRYARFAIACLLFLACWLLLCSVPAAAHPMGNFSISHYAGIRIERGYIDVLYLIDMAEIPTFQEIQQTHILPKDGDPSLEAYVTAQVETLGAGLLLEVGGRPLLLESVSRKIIFPRGAGGLPTLKLGLLYRARFELGHGPQNLSF